MGRSAPSITINTENMAARSHLAGLMEIGLDGLMEIGLAMEQRGDDTKGSGRIPHHHNPPHAPYSNHKDAQTQPPNTKADDGNTPLTEEIPYAESAGTLMGVTPDGWERFSGTGGAIEGEKGERNGKGKEDGLPSWAGDDTLKNIHPYQQVVLEDLGSNTEIWLEITS